MSDPIPPQRLERKRLEKFHRRCVEGCSSGEQFRKRFDVNVEHIAMGAALKNPMRRSINNEDIAAIIRGGSLLYDKSQMGNKVRIAIQGKFLNFEWINLNVSPIATIQEEAVIVRVVIQETQKTKDFIVTVYAWSAQKGSEELAPEVEREIW